jgi:hypothetical protein
LGEIILRNKKIKKQYKIAEKLVNEWRKLNWKKLFYLDLTCFR